MAVGRGGGRGVICYDVCYDLFLQCFLSVTIIHCLLLLVELKLWIRGSVCFVRDCCSYYWCGNCKSLSSIIRRRYS